jgi:hypothetical protein
MVVVPLAVLVQPDRSVSNEPFTTRFCALPLEAKSRQTPVATAIAITLLLFMLLLLLVMWIFC